MVRRICQFITADATYVGLFVRADMRRVDFEVGGDPVSVPTPNILRIEVLE